MVSGILFICTISIVTTWITGTLRIPIPGAIFGLLLLTFICAMRGKPGASLDRSSQLFTLLIPLLIMPSCIGIMEHWHLIKKEWLAILVAITSSVLFTLITTPWLYSKLKAANESNEREAL